jgi:hypothetical protein
MMFKVGQGLSLQQIPKHPVLISRFLHGYQALNLTEGHHTFDPLLWATILESSKLSGLLGGWVVWIHENLQLDPLRLVHISHINLVHLLHLGDKRNGWGELFHTEGGKATEELDNLLTVIVWIDFLQQKFDNSDVC